GVGVDGNHLVPLADVRADCAVAVLAAVAASPDDNNGRRLHDRPRGAGEGESKPWKTVPEKTKTLFPPVARRSRQGRGEREGAMPPGFTGCGRSGRRACWQRQRWPAPVPRWACREWRRTPLADGPALPWEQQCRDGPCRRGFPPPSR